MNPPTGASTGSDRGGSGASAACTRCGAAKPPHAPCPRCLLQLGLSAAPPARDAQAPAEPRARPAAPAPEDLALHFPGLEIHEAIGSGGMGVVYRARHKKLDRLVALKILAPELEGDAAFAERFLREARAMARLDHPHIVAVYDFGETAGLCWLLMEHVDGVDLRAAMRSGAMTPERALAIVPQLCDALQAAHDLGIVHRDIKPENVLLDRAGRAKIADFGLAKLSDHEGEVALTRSDVGMGTLHYMAPEQLRGASSVDHRADIFSLGVVLYEMLTGQLPIGRFELPSAKLALDVRLDEVVLRALESEPARRYQQAAEVKTDVQAIRGDPQAAGARAGGGAARAVAGAPPAGAGTPPAAAGTIAAPEARGAAGGLDAASPGAAARAEEPGGFAPRDLWMRRRRLALFLALTGAAVGISAWRDVARLGYPGLALVVAACVLFLYVVTRAGALQMPGLLAAMAQRSRAERVLRASCFVVLAAFGVTGAGAGLESLWELGTDHYVASTSPARALDQPWNEGYGDRLVRMLPEYAHAGATTPELGSPDRRHWFRQQLPNPAGTFLIAFCALWLAGIALAWRGVRGEWGPIATPALGVLVLGGYGWFLAQMRQSGMPNGLHGVLGTLVRDDPIQEVRAALRRELEQRGHEIVVALGETLVEKRTRAPVAEHELLASRPASPLARWQYEADGPHRSSPGLVIELVAAPGSRSTSIRWDAGLLRDGDPVEARWRAEIEALLAAR